MRKSQKRLLMISVAVVAVGLLLAYFLLQPQAAAQGAYARGEAEGYAESPFGEYIRINLGTSAQTSQASWLAAVAQTSQNVWTVNGTYKSQALVTLGYSLQVSYANVQNIKIVNLYIKAVDADDSSSYTYTLANNKALSGGSPISDSGSTQKSISQHLSDCQASATSAQIKYYIYCQVQAQGTISGQTLTAEVAETWFATLNYQQSTEQTQATVTPSVNVASWVDDLGLPSLAVPAVCIGLAALAVVLVVTAPKKRRGRR